LNDGVNTVTVQIKYKDVEENFTGNLQEVWLSINKFFTEFLPSFEVAKKLAIDLDLQILVKECQNIIAITGEGPYILVSKDKLTDNETLELVLLATYLSSKLRGSDDIGVSKNELQVKLGKSPKIASTRLGELVKGEIATRTPDDRYKITTFGIFQMQKEFIPKIRAKMNV
jgi:hypothetical protein